MQPTQQQRAASVLRDEAVQLADAIEQLITYLRWQLDTEEEQ